MQSLVIEVSGEARTSTAIIASGVEQPHHSVITLVRKYLPMLMQIGRVEFEIQPFKTNGGTQKRELAWLNEHQATFLITLMRNTEKVVAFKFSLVKQFFEMAAKLTTRAGLRLQSEFLKRTEAISLAHSRPFGVGLSRRRTEKRAIKHELALLDLQLQLSF